MYKFNEQIEQGQLREQSLDSFFGRWFDIEPVNQWFQRMGIDRLFKSKKDGRTWTVEYKADDTAANTGNAFIETISVDVENKVGWAYTSCAQLLMYYIPPIEKVYILPMTSIKKHLPEWIKQYRKSPPIPNEGQSGLKYNTYGVLVPLSEIEQHCYGIFEVHVIGVGEL